MRRPERLVIVAAGLVVVIAGVHLQQYLQFMSEIPTVGVLFLLNAAGGAGLAVALFSRERTLRLLAGLGSMGLAAGSLGSIAIAMASSFFGYSEATLRLPILVAILAEVAVIPVVGAVVLSTLRQPARIATRAGAD